MRRILFVVSLIIVLNKVNPANAEDVNNWDDFVTEASDGHKTINLTDNLEAPAGLHRLLINGSSSGRRYFSVTGNSYSIKGNSAADTYLFWGLNYAQSTFSNLTLQDFRPSARSGDFGGIKLQNSELTLNKFNVKNFSNPENGVSQVYGGVLNITDGSVLRLQSSEFSNNKQYASSANNGDAVGGVIHIQGKERNAASYIDFLKFSSFTDNAIISQGQANAYGGAIFAEGYIDTLAGDSFNNNSAQAVMDNTNAYGGAISLGGVFSNRGTAYLTYFGRDPRAEMSFSGNKAIALGNNGEAVGGAVFVSEYGKTEFNQDNESWMTFSGNIAQADNGTAKGGAIANYYKADNSVNMWALNLDGNKALGKVAQGGAVYNSGVINIISDNTDKWDNKKHAFTFTNNTAEGETAQGGALYNSGTINTIQNVTFNGNKAKEGGAIYNAGTIGTLENTKFETSSDTIENASKATIGNITDVTVAGLLNNSGTIADMTGQNSIQNLANNAGAELKSSGALSVAEKFENNGKASFSGKFTAENNAENNSELNFSGVEYSGGLTNNADGTFTATGENTISKKLSNAGTASISDKLSAAEGTENTGKMTFSNAEYFGDLVNNNQLKLADANTLTGSITNNASLTASGNNEISGSFVNAASGIVENSGDLTITGNLQNENAITNTAGTLEVIDGTAVNSGTISGGIKFSNSTLDNSGKIDKITDSMLKSSGDALRNSGTIDNLDTVTVNGKLLNLAAALIENIKDLMVDGELLNDGKINAMTGYNQIKSLQNNGTLNSNGSLIVRDKFVNSSNAVASISGELIAGGTINDGKLTFTDVDYGGYLVNNGDGTFTATGKNLISEKFSNSGTANISGELNALEGIENDGGLIFNNADYTGVLINNNQFMAIGANKITGNVTNTETIINSGVLEVAGGNASNSGKISGGIKFSNATLDNSGEIDSVYDSAFTTASGTALNNTGSIGEIKNSVFDYGANGVGIATTKDLTLAADNGNLTFNGSGTAIKMEAANTVNIKSLNGGKVKIAGIIEANGGKLALSGDGSDGSEIVLNGTVDNANVSLADANLLLGNTEVLANSSLNAQSGTISFGQDNYDAFKIKNLESSENAKWNFNIALSKENGNKANTLEIAGGSGKVKIASLNVDSYLESLNDEESHVLQLIKSSSDNAPELTYDKAKVLKQAEAVMSTDDILAKEFGLATTKTTNDSIQFRGLMNTIAKWAELDTNEDKKFSFNQSPYTISRDIDALRGNNITFEGNGNVFDVNNKNILAKIGAAQNVTINKLTLNNTGTTVNNGTLSLNEVQYNGNIANDANLKTEGNTKIAGKLSNTGLVKNSGNLTVSGGLQNENTIANSGVLKIADGDASNSGKISGGIKFSNSTLDNSGEIDSVYDSAFTTASGTALNNTGSIGEIKNSAFDYGANGVGIATTKDLTLAADNGDLSFNGSGTAIKAADGNTINIKAENDGHALINGAISGKTNLVLDGDKSATITLNGNVGNSDVLLKNTNLEIGGVQNGVSNVLADAVVEAQSGTISFKDNNYAEYKIKELKSGNDVRYHFDIELSTAGNKSDVLSVEKGSGRVHLSSLNVGSYPSELGDREEIVQLIKSASGEAPELYYDDAQVLKKVQAVMNNTDIVANSFGLYTTTTKNDSIIFRGLKDALAEWAELDTAEDKVFSFVDGSDYKLSRDITALNGKNLTIQGNDNALEVNNHNLLAEIGAEQNVLLKNLRVENAGTTVNNGTLTLADTKYNGVLLNKSVLAAAGNSKLKGKAENNGVLFVADNAVLTAEAGLDNTENGTIQNNGQMILAADSENKGTIVGSVTAGNGTDGMTFANNGYISGKTFVADKATLQSDLDKLNDVEIAKGGLFAIGADGLLNQNISGEGETLVSGLLNIGGGSLSQAGILTVADGGTINIGEKQVKVGTFNLNGTLQLAISSITANAADYTGGQIIVGSGANIAEGAKLSVTVDSDLLSKGQKTGELQVVYGENVNGVFNTILSNNRYDITAGSKAGTIIISNKASGEDIAGMVGNRNNRNTAKGWDTAEVPDGTQAARVKEILNELSQHDSKGYVEALTKVAPSDSQLAMMTTREVNGQINRSIWNRYSRNRYLCNTPFAKTSMWMEGFGNYAHQNSRFEAAGFNAHTAGYMLGVDGTVDCDTTAGFGYAFNNTKATSQGRNTGIKGHTLFGYAKYQPQQAYTRGTLSYGYAEYDERTALEDIAIKSKYHVQALSAEAAAGYEYKDGFIPEAGLRYTYLMPEKYTDSIGQHIQAENVDLLTGFAGMHYRPRCGRIWYNVRPTAYAGLTYDIYSRDTTKNVVIGSSQYEISGEKLSRYGVEAGIGVEISVNRWDLSVGYDFGAKEKYQSHTGMFKARYNF